MTNFTKIFGVAVVLAVMVAGSDAGVAYRLSKFKGRIIAYRPAERVTQVPSHVLNKESFLFRVSNGKLSSQNPIIKLIYEHEGYSRAIDDALSKSKFFRIKVRRDPTCDESYGQFVRNSPVLTLDKKGEAGSVSDVNLAFIGSVPKPDLSSERGLKCYRLRDGGISIEQ